MTSSQETGTICIGCGLCCDGTLYSTVTVEADDHRDSLTNARFTLLTGEDREFFQQPCPAFTSGCCAVYDNRPGVCARYRCHLLTRYEAGEIARADAVAVITHTIAIRDQVRADLTRLLGSDDWRPPQEMIRRLISKFDSEPDPTAAKQENSPVLLSAVGLRGILRREFQGHEATYETSETPRA